jgi:hypothetical protein
MYFLNKIWREREKSVWTIFLHFFVCFLEEKKALDLQKVEDWENK